MRLRSASRDEHFTLVVWVTTSETTWASREGSRSPRPGIQLSSVLDVEQPVTKCAAHSTSDQNEASYHHLVHVSEGG